MIKDMESLVINVGVRLMQLEAREKALLKILAENNIVDLDDFNQKQKEKFNSMKKDYMMELLDLNEEEYQEIVNRNKY